MTIDLIGAWLWSTYGKAITDKALGAAKDEWSKFNWNEAAQKYRIRVKALHSTTRMLGNPKPVSLAGIYTDLYILDKPTAFHRFDIEQLRALQSEIGP